MDTASAKTSFETVFKQSSVSYMALVTSVQERAGVSGRIVASMLTKVPVSESDAKSVLVIFSEITGKTWTLDTVEVALLSANARKDMHHG